MKKRHYRRLRKFISYVILMMENLRLRDECRRTQSDIIIKNQELISLQLKEMTVILKCMAGIPLSGYDFKDIEDNGNKKP